MHNKVVAGFNCIKKEPNFYFISLDLLYKPVLTIIDDEMRLLTSMSSISILTELFDTYYLDISHFAIQY